ncbi:MAG: hypothetical protein WBE42_20310 [Pseudolabrys sp.]
MTSFGSSFDGEQLSCPLRDAAPAQIDKNLLTIAEPKRLRDMKFVSSHA